MTNRKRVAAWTLAGFVAASLPSSASLAQPTATDSARPPRPSSPPTDLIAAQLEPSYISFGAPAFNIGWLGNQRPMLLFEANIAPHLSLRTAPDGHWAAVLTPKIILRMVDTTSFPVRTPSYMPQLTFYYSRSSLAAPSLGGPPSDGGSGLLYFLRLTHHSDGQEDPTYLPDGRVNYKSGQFSTNFAEFGINLVRYDSIAANYYGLSYEYHPRVAALSDSDLWGRYGESRVHLRGNTFLRDHTGRPWLRSDLDFQSIYLEAPRRRTSTAGSIDVAGHVPGSDDFWIFARYSFGQDYYNIHWHGPPINTLLVGVMGIASKALNGP